MLTAALLLLLTALFVYTMREARWHEAAVFAELRRAEEEMREADGDGGRRP